VKNDVILTYKSFIRRASAENTDRTIANDQWALLMTLQHLIDLNFYDRNRYDERLRSLEAAVFRRDDADNEARCSPPPS
jgi:hypothetical protein